MGSGGFLLTYMAAGIFGCVSMVLGRCLEILLSRICRNILGGSFLRDYEEKDVN